MLLLHHPAHQIDMDTIETSNLNRQFLFRKRHVGQSKALVATEAIKALRPGIDITSYQASLLVPRLEALQSMGACQAADHDLAWCPSILGARLAHLPRLLACWLACRRAFMLQPLRTRQYSRLHWTLPFLAPGQHQGGPVWS